MGGVVRSGGCEAEVGALDVAGPFPPPPGFYNSAAGPGQGRIRKADGSFVVFNVPNSKGTFPVGIAANGAVAGQWDDASQLPHGFLRQADAPSSRSLFPGRPGPLLGRLTAWEN